MTREMIKGRRLRIGNRPAWRERVRHRRAWQPEPGRDPAVTTTGKAPAPANDDGPRRSAIVTAQARSNSSPDMTPEEHRRRGDAADTLFREMKRRIAAVVRSGGALPPKKP